MPGATINQAITARFGADLSPLARGVRRAQRMVGRAGQVMKRAFKVAAAAAAALGAALVAAMARGVQKAAEFGAEMTKLETLVGINREQVSQWRGEILRLGTAVGKGPEELSRAMFAITSGGLRGAEAMETLRQAAKASAIGLGDVAEIGRTATAALQAFGDEGLTATKAIDVMVATVRAGNLRAEELAGSLGKVTGIADTVGVSFEEVNAFIATFTRLGTGADVAATSLRQVLASMVKPTEQQRDAFKAAGTSIDQFRQAIQEKGLTQAMIDLIQAQEGNLDILGELIPDVRALSGVLGTAGSQSESYLEITEQVNDALGLTDEGFQRTNDTMEQTINRLKAVKDAVLIEIGQAAIPVLQEFLNPENVRAFVDVFVGAVRSMVSVIQGFVNAAVTANRFLRDTFIGRLFGLDRSGTGQLAAAQQNIDTMRTIIADLERGGSVIQARARAASEGVMLSNRDASEAQQRIELIDRLKQAIEHTQRAIDKEGGLADAFSRENDILRRFNELADRARESLQGINVGLGSVGGGPQAGQQEGPLRFAGSGVPALSPQMIAQQQGAPAIVSEVSTEMAKVPEVADKVKESLADWKPELSDAQKSLVRLAGTVTNQIAGGIAQVVTGISSFGDVAAQVGQTILREVVGALIKAIAKATILKGLLGAGTGGVGLLGGLFGGLFKRGGMISAQRGMTLQGSGSAALGLGGAIPILAHPGEAVLNRGAVQQLGGSSAVRSLNRSGQGMRGEPGQAGGMKVEGDLNLELPNVRDARDLERELPAVLERLRRKGALGKNRMATAG